MSLPTLSGTGRLTADPAVRWTAGGKAVCELRVAFNARRYDRDQQQWVDGDSCYLKATAWESLAEHLGDSLSKGDAVVVSGRVRTEQWEDRNGGGKRSQDVLLLDSCGPDLARAVAKPERRTTSGGFRDGSQARPTGTDGIQTGGYDDPWGSAPPAGQPQPEEAPF